MSYSTAFIVGAGFCVDANAYLDPADKPFASGYPLVSELAAKCFQGRYDLGQDVEGAFANALRSGDRSPVQILVDVIESADHYVGSRVARAPESIYYRLIDAFPKPTFISFNYDALVELMLHHRRIWTPRDGFGVACRAEIDESYIHAPAVPPQSEIHVLHLHGSVYLYALEFETYQRRGGTSRRADDLMLIRETATEEFHFDPDKNTLSFIPFRGGATDMRYKHPDERIIIPIPDKSPAIGSRFSRAVFESAIRRIESAERCIAIGYSFADCDAASFQPLLNALRNKGSPQLFIIAPDASLSRERLKYHAPWLNTVALDASFGDWARENFPM